VGRRRTEAYIPKVYSRTIKWNYKTKSGELKPRKSKVHYIRWYDAEGKEHRRTTEFEKATCQLFDSAFGFETHHVGPIGLTPDVLLISNESGYQAIIDNKAYARYSITNDHHNRMVHNYIRGLNNYSSSHNEFAFFSYIAGGFSSAINGQLASIYEETQVKGSAISVSTMIEMVERNQKNIYSHEDIKNIFSVGRKISSSDL
jgi:hypothetical protein